MKMQGIVHLKKKKPTQPNKYEYKDLTKKIKFRFYIKRKYKTNHSLSFFIHN